MHGFGERYRYGVADEQWGELVIPTGEGPHPVVVNLHGGYWRARYDLGYTRPMAGALVAAGFAVWNVEYRRVGQPGGGWPGTLLDVARAVDHLRVLAGEQPLDIARSVALGHSAGGQLALWAAARHRLPPDSPLRVANPLPLRGVVALAPVADLRWASQQRLSDDGMATDRFLGGPPDVWPERYAQASPYELLPLGVPQRLLHGTADSAVPLAISERYVARARALGDDALLHSLPGADHFAPVEPGTDAWKVVLAYLAQLLAE